MAEDIKKTSEERKADSAKQAKAQTRQKEAQDKKTEEAAAVQTPAPTAVEHKKEAKAQEAAKPLAKEQKKTEKAAEKPAEKLKEERILTVSLRRAWKTPKTRRARAAVKVLKSQLERHLKKEIKIDGTVNQKIWENGITNPPHKLKLKVQVFENFARAFLA